MENAIILTMAGSMVALPVLDQLQMLASKGRAPESVRGS